ncbi:MAG: ATP-binding protein [Steroidobacteraceae bacterium]|nr:ATP-binding protein [Steroidobacteraceae bacterium]
MEASRKSSSSIGLGSWLGGGSALVVAIAVAAMAFACSIVLGRLVEAQALARVQLAAASARDQLRRIGEDTLSDARVLAERPTLQRLLATDDPRGLEFFLRRFCQSSLNDACAILGPSGTLAVVGTAMPWEQVIAAMREQGERFIVAPRDGSALAWGATVTVTGFPEWRAVALRVITPALLADMGQDAGAGLRLLNFATYGAPESDEFTVLHARALAASDVGDAGAAGDAAPRATSAAANGAAGMRAAGISTAGSGTAGSAAAPIRSGQAFGATLVVEAPTGEVVGLLDADLDGASFATSVQDFQRWLALVALGVAAIAGVAGLLYGRWLARPVVELRDAALRIGRGDLSVSMPAVAPSEVGALARTMEEMRGNLTELTDALRRSEAEARAVLGGITEGVYAVDAERRIRYANPQVMRLLQRPESEVIGRFCGDVLRPRPGADGRRPCEAECPILRARGSDGQARAAETLCLEAGATRSTVIVSAAPVGGQQVQVIRDETDLEAARRARDSVLGNISHEFRTPLAAQLASIEMLREGLATLGPEPQAELLGNVERGVLRLMRLVDNLLESVRIESGQLEIRRRSVDLDEVIDEALALLGPLFAQRSLRVLREHAGEPSLPAHASVAGPDVAQSGVALGEAVVAAASSAPTVVGDAQRLVQVLVNLLANAIKFAPERSTLRIGVAPAPGGRAELWVEDEGPGIPGGSGEAIFARFQRGADAGDEPDAPGLGLGLWIVKSIVERHQGSVRVERTAESRTRFTVSLPAESP